MNTQEQLAFINQHGATDIIEQLAPFISESREQRITEVINARLHSIQLAIETPSDINNALAAIRTCEALGIGKIHLISPEGDARFVRSVTQGAFYWVNLYFHNSLQAFLAYAKQHELLLAGGSLRTDTSIDKIPVNNTQPLCIIIGNEHRGLSPELEQACDILYKIPMAGMSESMNLSVSAAISLYDTSQRKRELMQRAGDLDADEKLIKRAQYYLHSVNDRIVNGLFNK